MNTVKFFAIFLAISLVFPANIRSGIQAAVASQYTVQSVSGGVINANQSVTLLDVTLPNPGLDIIVHDASSPTAIGAALATTALRYVDANGNGTYDGGEFLTYDAGTPGVLEAGDFHETGVLPTNLLQAFSASEPSFMGYIDADGNGAYTVGERILSQEMAGPLGTLTATPDPIPFTIYEKILDMNGNGSYDPYEPIVYDADNSYNLSAGDDVLSPTSTNQASLLRTFSTSNSIDRKVCMHDTGSIVGAADETDKYWWDAAGTCASFTAGTDVLLVGTGSVVGSNMQVFSASNMASSLPAVWMGYWDSNNDGSYTCSRTGSCETLVKSDYITPQITAGRFNGGEEFFASSLDATNGCHALASCVAWDEPNSQLGTLSKDLSLYHVVDGSSVAPYSYKHDILDVVDPGTVPNATNGLLRAFPGSYRFYGTAGAYDGSQAMLSIVGSATLASGSSIIESGPVATTALPSTMRFTDVNGDGIRQTNEDLVNDIDLSGTYRTHRLQSMTVENAGSATSSDFRYLSLYQESGVSPGWDSNDPIVNSWSAPFFHTALTATGSAAPLEYNQANRRFYVRGTLGSSPVWGRTVRLGLSMAGVQMSSNIDGPSDQTVMNPTTFSIGTVIDTTAPEPVQNVTVVPGYAQNALSWSLPSASDLGGVTVRVNTTSYPATPSDGWSVYTGLGTSFVHTGTPGQIYYYSIFAYDTVGNYSSGYSTASTMLTSADSVPPAPVSSVWAAPGNGQFTLTWQNPSSDFAQTVVRMSTAGYPSSPTSGLGLYAGAGTSITTGATNGTTYYLGLWAMDAAGNASSRMTAMVTPYAPTASTTPITVVPNGSLIKGSAAAVYYYSGGKRHVFPNEAVFYTWFDSFSGLYTVSNADLSTIPLGPRITVRPGTYLMKIQSDNRVWAVEPGGVRRWVPSESIAVALYGNNWNRLIIDQDVTLWPDYTEGLPLTTVHPNGTVLLLGGNTYLIENGFRRLLTGDGYTANRVQWKHVLAPLTSYVYPTYASITAWSAMYSDPAY